MKNKIQKKLKEIRKMVLDIIFPIRCIFCQKENEWICKKCFRDIQKIPEQICGICEKAITPDGRTCQKCKGSFMQKTEKNYLDGLLVCASYKQEKISRAIHFFKYRFIPEISLPLGDLMIEIFQKSDLPLPDMILPVPLHQRRLRWRGFNQAFLLAKRISDNLLANIALDIENNLISRSRYTKPQMGVRNYSDRQKNISGAFSIHDPEKIRGKIILLVDDVATTGSTIFECAKILKNSGAREVFAIVLARQETKSGNN